MENDGVYRKSEAMRNMFNSPNQFAQSQKDAMQATAAMFIESYVDSINHMLKREALSQRMVLHPRYSPGYGDVSLEVQNIFFSLLPCTKIGLSLTDTLFMIPEKSVTAFIGIEHKNE